MEFSRPQYWSGQPFPSPGDLSNPGIEPRSPTLQVDSWPAEPQGKPKNTGVGSHSLLLGIFPTQGLNPGLPRCRRILHQLSHKGSPASNKHTWNPDLTSGGYFLLYVFLSLSLPSLKFTLLNSTILHMKISRGKENTDLWCSFLGHTRAERKVFLLASCININIIL